MYMFYIYLFPTTLSKSKRKGWSQNVDSFLIIFLVEIHILLVVTFKNCIVWEGNINHINPICGASFSLQNLSAQPLPRWRHLRFDYQDLLWNFRRKQWQNSPKETRRTSGSQTKQMTSNLAEQWKKTGCLGYIGDELLPSYVGIIINHFEDPY